jgi:hypothetical protein
MKKSTFSKKQRDFDAMEQVKKLPTHKAWYLGHCRPGRKDVMQWAGDTSERNAY